MTKRRESFLERPLPSNDEAETVILGAIILDRECIDQAMTKGLAPEDFYTPQYRLIYEAMVSLRNADSKIDPITISEQFKREGWDMTSFGGVSYITNLTMGLPHFSNIEVYVETVKKHSIARQYIRDANDRINDLLAGTEDVSDVLAQGEATLLRLSSKIHSDNKHESKSFYSMADITPTLKTQFEAYHRGESNGCPTGFPKLDTLLEGGGLQPGGVYLIAAQEKSGKTSLALGWAYYAARLLNYTTPIVTMEMSKENLAKRLFAAHSGIPYYMFRPGFHDTAQNPYYTNAIQSLEDFAQFPILIADNLYGFEEIARHLRRVKEISVKSGKPMKFAVIDYLQIMTLNAKFNTREQEVSGLSRALKKLAMELEVALVIMSSLNREGLGEGQEPDAKNLRDSGQLAFDAEALMFLHDPLYVPGKPYERKPVSDVNLILARQRNGPTGRMKLKFIGPYMQFMPEEEFLRSFSNKAQEGTPLSTGQMMTKDEDMDMLWGQIEEEKR